MLRNVRYVYDNSNGQDSFTTAFQLPGMVGSGELLSVPLTTVGESAIIEVTNTHHKKVTATVRIYDINGQEIKKLEIKIPARGTRHLIVDDILGPNTYGTATIRSCTCSSLVAVAMHYGRKIDGGIEYMYGIEAREALGTVLRGTYNTFLSQQSELMVVNPTSEAQEVDIAIVRSDGTELLGVNRPAVSGQLRGTGFVVPANGIVVLDLGEFEIPNNYGVVTVQPAKSNSITSWIVRRKGDEYVMPTPVRQ
jgi:hypothetical protein